ncbi:cAMP-dependent protein kinase catalytic subunit [Elasticomyces elasticus]|nr:cAMP-dependent protein kinase catalytic subunit [Elasticomyces elasticus]
MDCMREQFGEDVLLDGRFQTISPLNHGSFGMVFMAKDVRTDDLVAVKCLTKRAAAASGPVYFAIDERSEELAIHSRIGTHPNIVNLIHAFETPNHVYLVLEFCPNGDLYEAIRMGRGPLETQHVRDFMFQLVDAIDFMHSRGIYHRDIKPENIFLTQTGSIKLGDFGLATSEAWSTECAVGSDRYMAPEQFDDANDGYSPAAADIWAMGICLLNVLFSRNPFATPTQSDPLFADFVRDRQSLFDVFPNMSQDTFNVLIHCLAIDPAKRSLAAVRDALEGVISFTTDDESLDEFCTDSRDVIPATANREPLRTPSVTSANVDGGGSFPWARALRLSPQKPTRQLSVIHDTESFTDEVFSGSKSDHDWYMVEPDNVSLASALDSGLGMSYKSSNVSPLSKPTGDATSKPVPICGSLPASAVRNAVSLDYIYGGKSEAFSKSWSDLWDEEEEEVQYRSSLDSVHPMERVTTAKPYNDRVWAVAQEDQEDAGRRSITPRSGLTELKDANSRSGSPEKRRLVDRVAERGLHVDSPATPQKYSPPSKRFNTDKWSMLGNLRRGRADADVASTSTPLKTQSRLAFAPFTSGNKTAKSRDRNGSWRRSQGSLPFHHGNNSGVWERKGHGNLAPAHNMWTPAGNWRQSRQAEQPASPPPRQSSLACSQQAKNKQHHGFNPAQNMDDVDDIGDLEWVGGWNDLHL